MRICWINLPILKLRATLAIAKCLVGEGWLNMGELNKPFGGLNKLAGKGILYISSYSIFYLVDSWYYLPLGINDYFYAVAAESLFLLWLNFLTPGWHVINCTKALQTLHVQYPTHIMRIFFCPLVWLCNSRNRAINRAEYKSSYSFIWKKRNKNKLLSKILASIVLDVFLFMCS